MPRPPLLLALFLAAPLAGCGGSSPGSAADAAGLSDAAIAAPDATPSAPDAGLEPADAAEPPDATLDYDAGPPCAAQAECGDVLDRDTTSVCVGGHCRAPGELVRVDFQSFYDQAFSQPGARPQVQVTRLFLGTRLDGVALTCADLLARSGATEATREALDTDPLLNQAFRNLTVLSWTGSTQGLSLFHLYYDAPRGTDYLLFAEAWYGPREGAYGSGARASTSCTEHVDLSVGADPKLTVLFKP